MGRGRQGGAGRGGAGLAGLAGVHGRVPSAAGEQRRRRRAEAGEGCLRVLRAVCDCWAAGVRRARLAGRGRRGLAPPLRCPASCRALRACCAASLPWAGLHCTPPEAAEHPLLPGHLPWLPAQPAATANPTGLPGAAWLCCTHPRGVALTQPPLRLLAALQLPACWRSAAAARGLVLALPAPALAAAAWCQLYRLQRQAAAPATAAANSVAAGHVAGGWPAAASRRAPTGHGGSTPRRGRQAALPGLARCRGRTPQASPRGFCVPPASRTKRQSQQKQTTKAAHHEHHLGLGLHVEAALGLGLALEAHQVKLLRQRSKRIQGDD